METINKEISSLSTKQQELETQVNQLNDTQATFENESRRIKKTLQNMANVTEERMKILENVGRYNKRLIYIHTLQMWQLISQNSQNYRGKIHPPIFACVSSYFSNVNYIIEKIFFFFF